MPTSQSKTIITLGAISQVLHLIQHRNRNQHRHSHWFRWLAVLKRNVNKLTSEARDQLTQQRFLQRVEYMRRYIAPKCYV